MQRKPASHSFDLAAKEITTLGTPVREVIAYEFDDFRLDVKRRELLKAGEPIAITHKAFQVLLLLVQNSEQTVEKEDIYRELWADSFVEDANLTQHVYILRKTLGKSSAGVSYIETVARAGYRFTSRVTSIPSPSVLHAQDYFSRPRGGAEPALKLEPVVEPHLRLATVQRPADDLIHESDERVTVSHRHERRILKWGMLGILGVMVLGVTMWLMWPRTPTTTSGTSIAVLPFKQIGQESTNAKLGLGMADSIITRLTMLRQVPVRPTSSVLRYTDRMDVNSIAAGREIGVDTVLEGTVQQDNNRVRVSVQLLEVASGRTIWGDSFDENYTDIFNLQDSISKRVVRALHVRLTPQEEQRIASRPTTNTEAFQAFQLGVYHHGSRSKDNLLKAEEYFKQAIELDPNYARAYAMLADTYNMLRYYRFGEPVELRDKAVIAANKAIELDRSEPDAYVALAQVAGPGEQGRLRAKESLETALSLSPYNGNARMRYGWALVGEDLDRAAEQMRLAAEYDPLSAVTNGAYCNVLIFQRKFKDAIRMCEKAVEIAPESPSIRILLSDSYFLDGRIDDALKQINLRMSETRDQDHWSAKGTLAYYYLNTGRIAEADAIVAELESRVKEFPTLYVDLMILAYEQGKNEKGYGYFVEAYDRRLVQGTMLRFNPIWEVVWRDPKVQEMWNSSSPTAKKAR
jgi:TolB-like protein/DNA-binding winged helix-turn-helix (wHTH) protein/Tfp pilus assembly protein PilF